MIEDVADEFSDEKQEKTQDMTQSKTPSFWNNSLVVCCFIGSILALGIFIFLHFREEYVEVLQLDSKAKSYVVAQSDFEFFDEEKTIILREASIRDVGKLYKFDESEIQKIDSEFENFINNNKDWKKGFEDLTLSELFKVSGQLEEVLVKSRFTDPRTLQKMNEVDFSTDYYQSFLPFSDDPIKLPSYLWKRLSNTAFAKKEFSSDSIDFVVQYFSEQKWGFAEDMRTVIKLRNLTQEQIPNQYTKIPAGKRIIDQGEKVTARHIAILQAMKKSLSDSHNLWEIEAILGSILFSIILVLAFFLYLHKYRPSVFASNRKLALIATVILVTLVLAKISEYLLLNTTTNLIEIIRYPLFVPFTAILLCCMVREQTALLASGLVAAILPFGLAVGGKPFFIINVVAAVIAIYSMKPFRKRREILIVCAKVWAVTVLTIFALRLYDHNLTSWVQFKDLFIYFLGSGFFMLLTAILVLGFIPLLEFSFKIVTDMTLMEYIDPNNTVLRRLSMEAPGTYQHSIIVSMLAEAAAVTIGAHGLFCRVVALYHDIGKLKYPLYFAENKQEEMDMHQILTPEESANAIMEHVEDSVEMAKKIGLPARIIEVIHEHHGTTLAYYFYYKQQRLKERVAKGIKIDTEERVFRYNGPKPSSKESVIIMLADSLAAAARSLDSINEKSVRELMEKLIKEREEDGQFDESQLTFEDLKTVKESMIKTLVATEHKRVKYPERKLAVKNA